MRLLSLKDVQLTDAYAGLTAAEKAALASRWTAVPVDGVLSTGLLRSWLVSQTAQGAGWNRGATAASAGPHSVWRSQAVPAVAPSQTSLSSIWRDTRVGAMAVRVRDLAGRSPLQDALADRESPSARAQRIAGTGERAKASDYSVGGRSSEPNPAFANLMPTERRGVTETTVYEMAQQGIGFSLGDRLAEKDAALASWANESGVGLGAFSPRSSHSAEEADGQTKQDVLVGVLVGASVGAVIVLAADAEIAALAVASATAQALIAVAVITATAAAFVYFAEKVAQMRRDQEAARQGKSSPENPFNGLLREEGPWPRLSREESEKLRRYYFGHLDGTPWAVRGPADLASLRPHADPRAVVPRPDVGPDEASSPGSTLVKLSTGERLGTPFDPLRGSRARGNWAGQSFRGANPFAVDPPREVEQSAPEDGPHKPRPSVATPRFNK